MGIQRMDPDTMVKMPGLHQTVKVGNTVYIAGQVALDADGNFHGEGDVEAQLNQVYENLEGACRAYGGSLSSMVKTTTYIIDPDHFAAVSKMRQERYGPDAAGERDAYRRGAGQAGVVGRDRGHGLGRVESPTSS